MRLSCPFCHSVTRYSSCEDASLVWEGQPVCHRDLCREQAVQAQSHQMQLQLGIGFRPDQYQLPLHLEGS